MCVQIMVYCHVLRLPLATHLLISLPFSLQLQTHRPIGHLLSPSLLRRLLRHQTSLKPPPPPRISLDNLIFAVELSTIEVDALIFTLAKSANELRCADTSGVFWFDIDINVNCFRSFGLIDLQEEVGITWNVLLRGWGGVFTMMDYEGRVSFSPAASESWFSEELPSPRCCSSEAASGIVADLRLGFSSSNVFCEDEKVRIEKVCVGMLSIVNWRYVTVDDGLRYLQHFLLPNSTMCM